MARFIQYDRHQHYLLPPSVDEWLPEDHLARYIVEASVARMKCNGIRGMKAIKSRITLRFIQATKHN